MTPSSQVEADQRQVLDGFSEIAPYLSDPLVLSGFALLLAFGLFSALATARNTQTLPRSHAGRVAMRALHYGFILVLAVILLGFGLEYFRVGSQTRQADEGQEVQEAQWSEFSPLGSDFDSSDFTECRCVTPVKMPERDLIPMPSGSVFVVRNDCEWNVKLLASKEVILDPSRFRGLKPFDEEDYRHFAYMSLRPGESGSFDMSGAYAGGLGAVACGG